MVFSWGNRKTGLSTTDVVADTADAGAADAGAADAGADTADAVLVFTGAGALATRATGADATREEDMRGVVSDDPPALRLNVLMLFSI
jgi:hypothetical protein